jgi:hypothetical protein
VYWWINNSPTVTRSHIKIYKVYLYSKSFRNIITKIAWKSEYLWTIVTRGGKCLAIFPHEKLRRIQKNITNPASNNISIILVNNRRHFSEIFAHISTKNFSYFQNYKTCCWNINMATPWGFVSKERNDGYVDQSDYALWCNEHKFEAGKNTSNSFGANLEQRYQYLYHHKSIHIFLTSFQCKLNK